MKPAIAWRPVLLQGATLGVASVALLHTAGNDLNPVAGWLAPLALLRSVRQGKSGTLLLGLAVTMRRTCCPGEACCHLPAGRIFP